MLRKTKGCAHLDDGVRVNQVGTRADRDAQATALDGFHGLEDLWDGGCACGAIGVGEEAVLSAAAHHARGHGAAFAEVGLVPQNADAVGAQRCRVALRDRRGAVLARVVHDNDLPRKAGLLRGKPLELGDCVVQRRRKPLFFVIARNDH